MPVPTIAVTAWWRHRGIAATMRGIGVVSLFDNAGDGYMINTCGASLGGF